MRSDQLSLGNPETCQLESRREEENPASEAETSLFKSLIGAERNVERDEKHARLVGRKRLTHGENSFFKTLIDNEVTVELKNDIQIRGTLKSVDQYLNIKLDEISVVDEIKYPHLVRLYFFLIFSFRRRSLLFFREPLELTCHSFFSLPELGQECLHSRFRRQIRAPSS